MKKILIITGCICPNQNVPYLKLIDSNVRLSQYIDSIKFYIMKSDFNIIIFGENSNYNYNYDKLEKMALRVGKGFEWMSFLGDKNKVIRQGKGFGEGEILNYILLNSKYRGEIKKFFKITGRLKVININSILKRINENKNYFNPDINLIKYLKNKKPIIDTRFYFVQKSYYDNVLKDLYKIVDDRNDKQLESCFFQAINENGKYDNFPVYPNIIGQCAGNGLNYSEEPLWSKLLFNILSFFHIFKCNILFKFWYKHYK